MPLHDTFGINCENGQLLKIKAQVEKKNILQFFFLLKKLVFCKKKSFIKNPVGLEKNPWVFHNPELDCWTVLYVFNIENIILI